MTDFFCTDGDCPSWTCIGNDSTPELNVPRVKLTGTGKMPVADMRSINNAQPQTQQQLQQQQQQQFRCQDFNEQNGQARLLLKKLVS
jgi:hypothetical protein